MYAWAFMALLTTPVLCARSLDLLLSVSVHRVLVVISTLLDLRAEGSRVLRHGKPPCCGETSRKPRTRNWDQTQAIGALAHSFTNWAIRVTHGRVACQRKRHSAKIRNLSISETMEQILKFQVICLLFGNSSYLPHGSRKKTCCVVSKLLFGRRRNGIVINLKCS